MQYYNVHAHIFTNNNAPKHFLRLYLPKAVADFVDNATDFKLGAWLFEKLLSQFGGNGGRRYASFLKIGKSNNQLTIFKDLKNQYVDDPTMRFVALTMDMEMCGAGDSTSGYEGQLEEIIGVKKAFPDDLLLFLGIDPRWEGSGTDLLSTVKSYFDNKIVINETRAVFPFIGLKIYPSMGFYPFDERLKETFDWAAENNIPILSHCNYLGGIYNNDSDYLNSILHSTDRYARPGEESYPKGGITYVKKGGLRKWILGRKKATNNLNLCSYLMEPAAFKNLLTSYKESGQPLKICLAHFGGGNQIKAASGGDKSPEEATPYGASGKNWFTQIKELMIAFDSVYTDISYALHDGSIHQILIDEVNNPTYGNRVMFGTDYFLTEREGPERKNYGDFKSFANMSPYQNGLTLWDKVAHENIENFLRSSYYNGTVI